MEKLNSYCKGNGLTEAIKSVNNRTAQVILRRYPFKYRYPSEIVIGIMDICNLKCRHCYLQYQSDSAARGFMDYNFFKEIIGRISPLIRRTQYVNFNPVEALFHPRIFDMIDLVLEQNRYISMNINTNGMLLDESRIDNLLKRGIYEFVVSLDGCRKETVESFKTGVDFDRVIRNMKKLKERGGDKVCLGTCFVAHKNNINELMDYIDFCGSLGVTYISTSGFNSYTPEMADYCLYSETGVKEVDELFRKARQKAESMGITLRQLGTKLEPKGCGFASCLMYIDKKGNIAPCPLLSKKMQMSLLGKVGVSEPTIWGNVLEKDPHKIWASSASVDFRRLLYEEKLPKECTLCAAGYRVIC